jgi:hypothetical protein
MSAPQTRHQNHELKAHKWGKEESFGEAKQSGKKKGDISTQHESGHGPTET